MIKFIHDYKNISNVGKHDFDEEGLDRVINAGLYQKAETFSIGIFPWVLRGNGKSLKPGPVKVRISAAVGINKVWFMKHVMGCINDLDAGHWDGRKSFIVK